MGIKPSFPIIIGDDNVIGDVIGRRSLGINANKPEVFYGPHFIVNSTGTSLDLSGSDNVSVLAWSFHGGINQQWFIHGDGSGGVALMSTSNKTYVAPKSPVLDSPLVSTSAPYFWNVIRDGGSYKLTVPNGDLGIKISSSTATLRPISEAQVFIFGKTPDNQTTIQSKSIAGSNPSRGESGGGTINLTIKDLTTSGNGVNGLRSYVLGDRNLSLYLGAAGNQQAAKADPVTYAGKFNYAPYSTNENIAIVFVDGWVDRGRVFLFTTFGQNASGVVKAPFQSTEYVLKGPNANSNWNTFTVETADGKGYYLFKGTRSDENNITLNMASTNPSDRSTIQLSKLK